MSFTRPKLRRAALQLKTKMRRSAHQQAKTPRVRTRHERRFASERTFRPAPGAVSIDMELITLIIIVLVIAALAAYLPRALATQTCLLYTSDAADE